jgi:SpoVK/Ycf46/Vps4 family AAA+-type ATPase
MQDRQGEAFVIATANNIEALPPELLRKGRFDEIWFVDLPNATERAAILLATLRQYKRGDVKIDLDTVAARTKEFTGSEIASLVPSAMFVAFKDNSREITTDDLLAAAKDVTPLSSTAAEKLEKLREWAKGRARIASASEDVVVRKIRRQLDL